MAVKGSVKRGDEVVEMRKNEPSATNQDLEQLAGLFRLLSDKTRLNVLLMLGGGEQSVGDLCQMLDLPQPTVSHHLGLLRMNNVIANRRAGKRVFYCLPDGKRDAADLLTMESHKFSVRVTAKPQV
jgi:DNA-binding transcriptional ArsR family regulator